MQDATPPFQKLPGSSNGISPPSSSVRRDRCRPADLRRGHPALLLLLAIQGVTPTISTANTCSGLMQKGKGVRRSYGLSISAPTMLLISLPQRREHKTDFRCSSKDTEVFMTLLKRTADTASENIQLHQFLQIYPLRQILEMYSMAEDAVEGKAGFGTNMTDWFFGNQRLKEVWKDGCYREFERSTTAWEVCACTALKGRRLKVQSAPE